MQFSNSTTEAGIIQEIDRICGSTDNTYTLKAKTARVNQALDRFVTLALQSDGEWQWDDYNQTDMPIGTTDIVSGQYDYSFAAELLSVTKVLVADEAGNYTELQQVDQYDWTARNIGQQPTGNSGIPNKYDIVSNSIFLDPVPNYASNDGLKVWFKRNAIKFVSTDTTAEPGIPSLFHPYLCRYASLPFLIEKKLPQRGDVASQIVVDESAIGDFMANRNKTRKTRVLPRWRSAR
jgi:hypothetical protein